MSRRTTRTAIQSATRRSNLRLIAGCMPTFWPRLTMRILKAQLVAQFSPGFALQNGHGNEFGSNAGTFGTAPSSMPAMLLLFRPSVRRFFLVERGFDRSLPVPLDLEQVWLRAGDNFGRGLFLRHGVLWPQSTSTAFLRLHGWLRLCALHRSSCECSIRSRTARCSDADIRG